jgi:hypothetical protein
MTPKLKLLWNELQRGPVCIVRAFASRGWPSETAYTAEHLFIDFIGKPFIVYPFISAF